MGCGEEGEVGGCEGWDWGEGRLGRRRGVERAAEAGEDAVGCGGGWGKEGWRCSAESGGGGGEGEVDGEEEGEDGEHVVACLMVRE